MKKTAIILPLLLVIICIQSVHAEGGFESATEGVSTDETFREETDNKHDTPLPTASPQPTSSYLTESASESLQPSIDSFSSSIKQDGDSGERTVASNTVSTTTTVVTDKVADEEQNTNMPTQHTTQHPQVAQETLTDTAKETVTDSEKVDGDVTLETEKKNPRPDTSVNTVQSVETSSKTESEDGQVMDKLHSPPDMTIQNGEEHVTPGQMQADLDMEAGTVSGGSKVETGGKIASDHHDFQSYSEWRQKVLEEEQKSKQDNTAIHVTQQGISSKQKLKINFSSKNCGAKVLVSNQEAENVQGVLTSNKDDYMLNPCSVQKKWFAVELCEPVQLKTVEIASLELFSSQPKTFRLFLSDRFPAKEWREVGEYEARQEKTPQAFQIDDQQFVKFVKVELLDHYGSEHFCPITLFRVYGVPMADDEDEDNNEHPETTHSEEETVILQDGEDDEVKENSRNLFMSAKDTVMNLVKKVLNVEEGEKDLEESRGKDALLGTNYSHDGYLLPCVPEVDNKDVEKKEEKQVPTVSLPIPNTHQAVPSPTEKDLPIVTKLQDDEQIPSEHRGEQKLVTLVSSDQALELCVNSAQNKTNHNKTSPHRMVCSYVQTMLSNKIEQSCSPHDEASSTDASVTSEVVPLMQTTVITDHTTEDSLTPLSQVTKQEAVQSVSIFKASSSMLRQETSTVACVTTSQTVADAEEAKTGDSDGSQQTTSAVNGDSASQYTSIIQSKGVSSVLSEGEHVTSTISESTSASMNIKHESEDKSTWELEPSSSTTVEERSESLTQTPVLETQQLNTGESQVLSSDKSSHSVKVSPSPASDAASSEDSLPTKVITNRVSQEEVTEELDDQKENGESEVIEQLTRVENGTGNKDKPVDLMHVPLIPVAKRETAIMRLTNRIKALELNVSLSSRFLDELSHRFKKQSEDMMRLLNKTIAHFNNMSVRAEARDTLQQEQLDKLESRVENLTVLMSELSVGMEELNNKITDRQLVWTSVEFVFLVIVCVVCLRRGAAPSLHPDVRHLLEMMPKQPHLIKHTQRRNSVGIVGHIVPSTPIKKQASESALASAASSESRNSYEIVEEQDMLLNQHPSQKDGSKKKKKKKHKNLESKSSTEGVGGESETLSATELNKSAGLLFGADAVSVLTGGADPTSATNTTSMKSSLHKTSTKSLPTHSRQSSQTSIEIQKMSSKTYIPPKKVSVNHCGPGPVYITPPGSLLLQAKRGSKDGSSMSSSSRWGSNTNSDLCVSAFQQASVPALTNGSMSVKSSKSGHIWKSADTQHPTLLKSSKAPTAQKGLSFKKSFGFE